MKKSVFQEVRGLIWSWPFLLAVLVFALPGMILEPSITFKLAVSNLFFGTTVTVLICVGIALVKQSITKTGQQKI